MLTGAFALLTYFPFPPFFKSCDLLAIVPSDITNCGATFVWEISVPGVRKTRVAHTHDVHRIAHRHHDNIYNNCVFVFIISFFSFWGIPNADRAAKIPEYFGVGGACLLLLFACTARAKTRNMDLFACFCVSDWTERIIMTATKTPTQRNLRHRTANNLLWR